MWTREVSRLTRKDSVILGVLAAGGWGCGGEDRMAAVPTGDIADFVQLLYNLVKALNVSTINI